MSNVKRVHVLCVDDEARVVEGLKLHLRRDYEVHTALGGEEGLQKLKELGGVAVVISDMRMPGMDGAAFLKRVMHTYPDSTRILLTGEAARDAAVRAVNEGQIYRFLTKPCPPDQLKAAVDAAVIQHRLVNAERMLLQETVIGCIQALVDVLAIVNPIAFGRASRIKRLAMQFAESLGCTGFWQLEAAAMLSQIGYVSLPVELVEKMYYGERLTPEEQVLALGVPEVASKLLLNVPRLEPVMQILDAVRASDEQLQRLGDGTIGLGARILLLALDYDTQIAHGQDGNVAIQTLLGKESRYGRSLIDKFATHVGAATGTREILKIPLHRVQPGMTIMEDVRTHLGTLLIARGFEVSPPFLERLRNLGASILSEEVSVLAPQARAKA
ncbi:MAG TPA: HD domain-containing phosphohydrolase [Steroidobacteraceae bacterium]|jgi:response regulator RpfG family c-di-GMP phosphodiesterase